MASHQPVRKAVLPVAGLGTRFLPATKATPKEMLPVVDKPAIQYVVEEVVETGISDLLFVTGRNKVSLENHFDRIPGLEAVLEARGETSLRDELIAIAELATFHYVRQGNPLGLGHAVASAQAHVGDEPFVVVLGDDLVDANTPVLAEMIRVREQFGGSVLCLMEVPQNDISLYGCAEVIPTSDPSVFRVTGLIEKPRPEEAPSNLAVIGRYVLDPAIFSALANATPGKNGEMQLTDGLVALLDQDESLGGTIHAIIFRGKRFDTGDKLSYLKAVVEVALSREDLGTDFAAWLLNDIAPQLEAKS